MPTRSVLLVEDEPLIRAVLADALMEEGFSVSLASNVLEAIGVIGHNPAFDILITDVDMPGGLSGLDLASMVASHALDTNIIVMSGRAVDEGLRDDWVFIPKPFGVDAILDLLNREIPANGQLSDNASDALARAS